MSWCRYAQTKSHNQWLTVSQFPAVANGSLEAFPVDRSLFLSSWPEYQAVHCKLYGLLTSRGGVTIQEINLKKYTCDLEQRMKQSKDWLTKSYYIMGIIRKELRKVNEMAHFRVITSRGCGGSWRHNVKYGLDTTRSMIRSHGDKLAEHTVVVSW